MGYVFVVCFWYVLELKCDSTVLTPTLVTQAMSSFLICPKYRCFQQRLNHDRNLGLEPLGNAIGLFFSMPAVSGKIVQRLCLHSWTRRRKIDPAVSYKGRPIS